MKKILLMLMLLVLPMALAQTIDEQAGITPASPLHGLDRAIERFQVFLTRDTADKIGLEMLFAQERYAELIKMFHEKRDEKLLRKSTEEYQENIGRAISLTAKLTDEQKAQVLKMIQDRVQDAKIYVGTTEISPEFKAKIGEIENNLKTGKPQLIIIR